MTHLCECSCGPHDDVKPLTGRILEGYPDLYELSPRMVEALEMLGVNTRPVNNDYIVRSVVEAMNREAASA